MPMKSARPVALLILFAAPYAAADLPLSLEELFTDKGKLRLETSISYTNSESRQTQPANPIYIQTGANSYIAVGTAGLRYGITRKTEIYGNASYLWRSDRSFNGEARSSTAQNLSDITLGISHTFKQDGKNPALTGFAETAVYEKAGGKASAAKSWLIGASTYKAIDPVVLSLTTAYRRNGSRKLDAGRYKAGDYFMLSPSVSFAANDRISFTGGVQWIARQADRLDGKKLSSSNTATYANLGVGYGISRETSISANARFNVSGRSSTTLRLGVQHTF